MIVGGKPEIIHQDCSHQADFQEGWEEIKDESYEHKLDGTCTSIYRLANGARPSVEVVCEIKRENVAENGRANLPDGGVSGFCKNGVAEFIQTGSSCTHSTI